MSKKSLQPIKTYFHLCSECEKEFETDQKMENCPDCSKPFKEVWAHLVYPSRSAYRYRHECKECKIIIDDGSKEERFCSQCGQLLVGEILSISYILPNNFWGKVARKIRKCLLP
jgi:rRNA maturation endonuclease Nob1